MDLEFVHRIELGSYISSIDNVSLCGSEYTDSLSSSEYSESEISQSENNSNNY